MSYGPDPWRQAHWDWRAAGNYIGGGAGAGLLIVGATAGGSRALTLAALMLVGAGLLSVWAEIGRPVRALNVFINPDTSWMSREAYAAAALMLTGLVALAWPALAMPAGLAAAAFLYCQGRILEAARGIPAWRTARIVPLILITGVVEGLGLALCAMPDRRLAILLAVGVLARAALWRAYRREIDAGLVAAARAALDRAQTALVRYGTVLPLTAAAWPAVSGQGGAVSVALALLAGVSATATGAYLKHVLITRASFNQGFSLARLPVRDARSR